MSGAGGRAREAAPRTFEDEHRTLTVFAHAIAGRPLRLLACGLPADAARLPRPAGDDGTLRVAIGGASARAMRIAVLREVLRAESTPPAGRAHAGPHPREVLRRRVVATLERLRVDAELPRRWPGAAGELDRLVGAALARRAGPLPRHPARALLAALERASLGASPRASPDAPALPATVLDELAPLRRAGATSQDVGHAADRIVAAIVAATSGRPRAGASVAVTPGAGPAPADAAPHGCATGDGGAAGDGPPGERPAGRPADAARGGPGARSGAGEAPEAASLAEPPSNTDGTDDADDGRDPSPAAPATPPRPVPAPRPGGVLHDEWDYLAGRWLRGWCRVHERRLRGADTGFLEDVRRRHPELARALRDRFARMRPAGRARVRGAGDGEELDLDALVGAVVDRRARHASDERLYVRRDPALREVAAAFLVDMSASTAVALPDPAAAPPPGHGAADPASWVDTGALLYGAYDDLPEPVPAGRRRRVVDVEKDALALMADALAALGDAYAIYGFSGHGRDDVEFHVAKDFADPPSPSAWAALAAIEPRGSTRMGAAIRHAAAKLARRPAARRLLVVVSDGYPQDTDYGPDRRDEEYGLQDTARALRDAEAAGIGTFCVTVDPAGHDYLRRMCPPRRYLVIDDVPDLPAELGRVYLELAGRG